MGSFIWIFGFVTISIPAGLAVYHYAIKKENGGSKNSDCCCKTQEQNGCQACKEPCGK